MSDRLLAAMTAAPAGSSPQASTRPLAPAWHTVVVLCVMLGVSLLGARARLPVLSGLRGHALNYLFAMLMEWVTVAFIAWGLSRRGMRLVDLIGGSWARGVHTLRDLAIGIAFIIVFGGAVQALSVLLKATPPPALQAMMPQTPLELAFWVLLSLTGGFCEEVIFRGYLQRQFSVLTGSLLGGIVLQASVFGLSHGYQGWKLMFIIALFGISFGFLAKWRGSLRPGMIGHALQDTTGGVLSYLMH